MKARLITGSPCFCVVPCPAANRDPYSFFLGQRNLFCCGTEKGKLLIGDITDGLAPSLNSDIKVRADFDQATELLA